MLRFVVRRLLLLVPILLGLSLLVFGWIRALPGSPAIALLGERATPETIAQIERQYGLDRPVHVQYWRYLNNVARAAMIVSILFGVPLGFVAAKRYGGVVDHSSLVASLLGISIPVFFLAIILKYVFAVKLGLLPTVGRISVLITIEHPTNFYVLDSLLAGNFEAFWDVLKHLVLPAVALGSIPLAIIARITRAAV